MVIYERNAESREVIAHIYGCKHDIVRRVRKAIGEEALSDKIIKAATIKDEFKSKVRCHPEDEFDASVGEKIAKSSVLKEYHRAADKAMRRVNAILERQNQRVRESMEKAEKRHASYVD